MSERQDSRSLVWFVVIALLTLATYQVYLGVVVRKLGIPGVFEIEFDRPSPATVPPVATPSPLPVPISLRLASIECVDTNDPRHEDELVIEVSGAVPGNTAYTRRIEPLTCAEGNTIPGSFELWRGTLAPAERALLEVAVRETDRDGGPEDVLRFSVSVRLGEDARPDVALIGLGLEDGRSEPLGTTAVEAGEERQTVSSRYTWKTRAPSDPPDRVEYRATVEW
jgi:hypothetical protein